jgi:hypothetical protein
MDDMHEPVPQTQETWVRHLLNAWGINIREEQERWTLGELMALAEVKKKYFKDMLKDATAEEIREKFGGSLEKTGKNSYILNMQPMVLPDYEELATLASENMSDIFCTSDFSAFTSISGGGVLGDGP